MVSELRSKKVEDHFVGYHLKKGKTVLEENITTSMENYLNMGLHIVRIARSWIGRIIYSLSRRVKGKGLLVALTGTLDDDNAWTIDSGASKHMTGESGQLQTL